MGDEDKDADGDGDTNGLDAWFAVDHLSQGRLLGLLSPQWLDWRCSIGSLCAVRASLSGLRSDSSLFAPRRPLTGPDPTAQHSTPAQHLVWYGAPPRCHLVSCCFAAACAVLRLALSTASSGRPSTMG